jgi:ribonuclease inhibitor
MSVKCCRLPGRMIGSLDVFYDEVAHQLDLPAYFGRNLDALWDVLTTDIAGPVKVVWEHATASREAMGEDFARVADLLKQVALDRDDFQVCFQWGA